MAAMASEGCCHKYRTTLALLLLEKARKTPDGRSLPVLILLCVPSSLSHFPGRSWAAAVHMNTRANGVNPLLFHRERTKKNSIGYCIACKFAGVYVVMFKGKSTSRLYWSQADHLVKGGSPPPYYLQAEAK